MRVAAVSGTGLVGRYTVEAPEQAGHDAILVTRSRARPGPRNRHLVARALCSGRSRFHHNLFVLLGESSNIILEDIEQLPEVVVDEVFVADRPHHVYRLEPPGVRRRVSAPDTPSLPVTVAQHVLGGMRRAMFASTSRWMWSATPCVNSVPALPIGYGTLGRVARSSCITPCRSGYLPPELLEPLGLFELPLGFAGVVASAPLGGVRPGLLLPPPCPPLRCIPNRLPERFVPISTPDLRFVVGRPRPRYRRFRHCLKEALLQ